jgi:integrase
MNISRNSASGYFSTFQALLKAAYKERLLKDNLNDFIEEIEYEEVKKNFLTADEVKQLAATPCEKPVLKAASLFSILTGLRISDILKLRWEDICPESNGEMAMFIRIQKTQKESVHPLSPEMLALCGEHSTGVVFKGFNRSMTQGDLKKWLKAVGITKRITFHRFRDTYATLQLAAGTDIYAKCLTMPT